MTAGRDDSAAMAWRPGIEMSKPELDNFLAGRLVARVATVSSSGFPLVTPLYYLWDGVAFYFSVTGSRLVGRNLLRDPRCAILVDIDERPLLGIGTNMAKAVHGLGEAELSPAEPGRTVRIEGGPLAGDRDAGETIDLITRRYALLAADGSVGVSAEEVFDQLTEARATGAGLAVENEGRLVAKVVPRRIRSWDFSKAPFLQDR